MVSREKYNKSFDVNNTDTDVMQNQAAKNDNENPLDIGTRLTLWTDNTSKEAMDKQDVSDIAAKNISNTNTSTHSTNDDNGKSIAVTIEANNFPSHQQQQRHLLIENIDTISLLSAHEQAVLERYARKVDLRIITCCALGYTLCLIDRVNIGSAKISGLEKDLKLTDTTYSIALSVFYVGYLVMQVWSNMILKIIGPSIWLPSLGIAFGAVSMSIAATKNAAGLIAARTFLGVFEAGLYPGCIYLISFWYPRQLMGLRITYFLIIASFLAMFSGPLAAGLSSIPNKDKTTGLSGWQWIFIIEGLVTVIWGIGALFVIKDYPDKAKTFDHEERQVIGKIMKIERNLASETKLNRKGIAIGLKDWKTWVWGAMVFCMLCSLNTNGIFGPALINSMGHKAALAQVLTIIPSLCGVLTMVLAMYLPKLIKSQFICAVLLMTISATGSLIMLFSTNNYVKFFGLCLLACGGNGSSALVPGLLAGNTGGVIKRGIVTGIGVCFGSFSGFSVSYMYPNRDAPQYAMGHGLNFSMALLGIIILLGLRWWYRTQNIKRDRNPVDVSHLSHKDQELLCDDHPDYRYIY